MQFANAEVEQLEIAIKDVIDSEVCELNDLQLAVVGGGTGEITTY